MWEGPIPYGCQKNHEFPHALMLRPRFSYRLQTFFAETRNFQKPLRIFINNTQRFRSETADNTFRPSFADSLNAAGGQKKADTFACCRSLLHPFRHLKLTPEFRMTDPASLDEQI